MRIYRQLLALMLACWLGPAAASGPVFPDPNLEAAVGSALSKPPESLTTKDVGGLTCLSAGGRQITNLEGLQWATNLQGLDLKGNAISNLTPLQGLTQLSSLDLEQNQIADLSPVGLLTNLSCLALGKNRIADYSALSNLTHLATFSVRVGGLRDLRLLQPMHGLNSLILWENGIMDISSLAALTSLSCLDLRWNYITNCAALLAGPTNLTSLYLGGNPLTNAPSLDSLKRLTLLNLDDDRIVDLSPLARLTNLTYLSLSRNPIANFFVLTNLSSLANLELRGDSISNVSFLTKLFLLNYADLAYNSISNISPLRALTNLNSLSLGRNPLTDYGDLSSMTSVSNLWLFGNSISDASVVANLSWLNHLDLEDNEISDVSPLLSLANLNGLSLSRNPIADCTPLSALTGLTSLGLDDVTHSGNCVSDMSFLAGLAQLRFLSLNQSQISDLTHLSGLSNLQDLYLRRNHLTDVSTLTNLPELLNVDISLNCLDLTSADSLARNAISNLQFRPTGAFQCSCAIGTNGLECQRVSLKYTPTNSSPRISTGLTTDWYVCANSSATWQVRVWEDGIPDAQFSVTAVSSNPGLVLITDGSLAVTNGVCTLSIIAGSNPANNMAVITLTAVDDVCLVSSVTVPVQVVPCEACVSGHLRCSLVDACFFTDTNLLQQIAWQCGKNPADLTTVDCLMRTNLVVNVELTDCCVWQYLTNLTDLQLVGSSVSNLACIANLAKLNTLRLRNTDIADLWPIAGLTNLAELDLHDNALVGMDVALTNLTKLVSLSLSGSILSDVCSLGRLAGLTSLRLYDNRLTDISCLAGLTNLTVLDLHGDSLTNVCCLQNLTGLTSLMLCTNRLIDVSCLQALTNLTVLDLHYNMLTNIAFLTNFPSLSTVDLRYNLLDTESAAVMGVIGSLTNRGAVVEYMPQRAAPIITILPNYVVAAGWTNVIQYWIGEWDGKQLQPVGAGVQVTNIIAANQELIPGNIPTRYTNTSMEWIEWYLNVVPRAGQSGTTTIAICATNDAGLGSSNFTTVTVTEPWSITNQVFSGTNLVWSTGGAASWFGQTVETNRSASAARSGDIGSLQASWLEADVAGPGILSYWWKVSSETNMDLLMFQLLQQSTSISGEVDWQQQFVSVPPGAQSVRWQYIKTNDRWGFGLDAGWVADVTFTPLSWLTVVGQHTNGGLVLSWPGLGAFPPATNIGAPWFQMATNVSGPWTDYMSATNSPLLISPSNFIPAQFFRLRL